MVLKQTILLIIQGMKTVFCSELDDNGFDWVADKIRGRVGSGPVYLSLDIDVADPAFAPGTGTPEVSDALHASRALTGAINTALGTLKINI